MELILVFYFVKKRKKVFNMGLSNQSFAKSKKTQNLQM